ncbi:hypothetical protein NDU88_003119 [Pleurodeles waltl]|uniref:Uncharacterized protein n=1 Tax=Pleurodeles waltl TaxID=8319 RepID=A0AAV7PHA4_PLEWA|nr:hypothetical protein NDU88_003119 [Pleurodeles waltl]
MSARACNMGKADKTQAKLQFDQRKSQTTVGDRTETGMAGGTDMPAGEAPDLWQILAALQRSLTQIDSRIDSLSYRMDRMTERLDKHADRLDQSERHISEVEDGQSAMAMGQAKMGKELATLRAKVDDLEARSHRNNLGIVGIAESTAIDNMEGYIERLLVQVLGQDTFSSLFVVERALRSLATRPPLGAPPRPIIAKLLNYRDRNAALGRARELKTLQHEGMAISLYLDFTQQVQEAGKRQLQELHLEYRMLYPAKLRVEVDGKPLLGAWHSGDK